MSRFFLVSITYLFPLLVLAQSPAPQLEYWTVRPTNPDDGEFIVARGSLEALELKNQKAEFEIAFSQLSSEFKEISSLTTIRGSVNLISDKDAYSPTFFGLTDGEAKLVYNDGKSDQLALSCVQSRDEKNSSIVLSCYWNRADNFTFVIP